MNNKIKRLKDYKELYYEIHTRNKKIVSLILS